MDYYKINYKKLARLDQIKYSIIIWLVIIIIIILFIISTINYAYNIESFYGIYNDNILSFKITTKLSDIFKEHNMVSFNNQNVNYKVVGFSDYEIIDNEVYETIKLEVDGEFYQNEVGEVKVYFDKKAIIFHILDLFKWGGYKINKLSNEEMLSVKGGAIKLRLMGVIIGGLVTFIAGLVNGLVNPQRCN